ncbi:hypothetical protein SLITO_v1c07770 [Spiroplasma litorale]|uniref:Uncharacterized protein n=1 Tax=Spiroplasma litorale TaxID=216942 RepID=A0A0K1W251_9MOLU|nr:hypothetical protein [Spiroplasma litorale]AKX34400.1 hypothetical protein SLITO_v1c07770 [Spiroplasma litorale]
MDKSLLITNETFEKNFKFDLNEIDNSLMNYFIGKPISKIELILNEIIDYCIDKKSFKSLDNFIKKYKLDDDLFLNYVCKIKNVVINNFNLLFKNSWLELFLLKILLIIKVRYDPSIWFKIKKDKKKTYSIKNGYIYWAKLILYSFELELKPNNIFNLNRSQIEILMKLKKIINDLSINKTLDLNEIAFYNITPLKYYLIEAQLILKYESYKKTLIQLTISTYFQTLILFLNENYCKLRLF